MTRKSVPFTTPIRSSTTPSMSGLGQSRHFKRATLTSGLPPQTDIKRPARLVRFVPEAEVA